MSNPGLTPYTLSYSPGVRDCGPDNRVRPVAYAEALQEAARAHAATIGWGVEELREKGLYWVLVRLDVAWTDRPEYGSAFTVKTWPKGNDRRYALRDFVMEFNGLPIGKARSSWMLLETGGKLAAIEEDWSAWGAANGEAWEGGPEKWIWPETGAVAGPLWLVGYSDLDINGHVNNARYWDWATDAAYHAGANPEEFRSVSAQYLRELRAGETIRAYVIKDETGCKVSLQQEGKPAFLVWFR